MNRRLVFILAAFCVAAHLAAQNAPKFSLKLDLSAPFYQTYGGAAQLNIHPKSALEVYCSFGSFPFDEEQIFNGDLVVQYAERRVDTFRYYFNDLMASSGWRSVGTGIPLPPAPAFVPYSFFQSRFGFRFAFAGKKSPWAVFIQPGLSVNYHRFYEVNQSLLLEYDDRDSWVEGVYPNRYRIAVRTTYFRQTRSMRLQNAWQLGLNYDLGVLRKFGKHFFLEGRISTGANLWLPYEEPQPPVPVRRFWARPALLAGWSF